MFRLSLRRITMWSAVDTWTLCGQTALVVIPVGRTRYAPPADALAPVRPAMHRVQSAQDGDDAQDMAKALVAARWPRVGGGSVPPNAHSLALATLSAAAACMRPTLGLQKLDTKVYAWHHNHTTHRIREFWDEGKSLADVVAKASAERDAGLPSVVNSLAREQRARAAAGTPVPNGRRLLEALAEYWR